MLAVCAQAEDENEGDRRRDVHYGADRRDGQNNASNNASKVRAAHQRQDRQAQREAGGWLPVSALETVADRVGLAYMRVLEIASFYTMYNLKPVGKWHLQLCGTTPCWLRGSDKIKKACQDFVGNEGEISKDNISWIEVECLGACVNAPAVQINEDYYEDLNYENMSLLINNIKKKKDIKAGSQTGRVSSEPIKMEESDA